MPSTKPVVVTGATGHLGRAVVENLLERGVAPERIVAGGRNLAAAASLAERGVDVRRIDYDDPASLAEAFAGAGRVLIVSGMDFGRRVGQHLAAAQAAKDAGAELVVYTSAPHAATTSMQLAADHRATEEGIRALGIPFTFLRNSWYLEGYTDRIPTYLEHGAVVGSAGAGRISGAARGEQAEAAAVVLSTDGHENATYELGGDDAFTLADLAALVAEHSGKPVVYRDVPVAELTGILTGAGLPAPVAAVIADVDRAIVEGALYIDTGDLSRLIGRPTTTLAEVVAAALR
jgi:NAD(P)H dehydrogenase (quinone)